MSNTTQDTFNRLPRDAEIESRAHAIFHDACTATDSYHSLRLGHARRNALVAGRPHRAMKVWAPLAGAAACCALVVGVVWMHPVTRVSPSASAPSSTVIAGQIDSDDATLDVGSSQVEMVQNLDFYRWVASQQTVSSPTQGDH